jgi:fructosamine-3-kinase
MQQRALAAWLQRQLGVELQTMTPVGGGCIHRAWRLQLGDGRQLFAKTNRAALLPVLEAEADGLRALGAAADHCRDPQLAPVIPEPLALAEVEGEALLVLSWLDLDGSDGGDGRGPWQRLGAGLAQLHRASLEGYRGGFGWARDNFIGSGPQANGWMEHWSAFFCQQRLGVQLAWAERSGHRLPEAAQLLRLAEPWLAEHPVEPVLVHGDLWGGNAGLLANGRGALFDPAIHRGDREVDLAMAQLFGGFPAAFFEGYQQEWPLPAGHQRRLELYNLYHLLNHANLFGGAYWQQSAASIQSLLRELG